MWSARYSWQILMKLEFSKHIFEKKNFKYQLSLKSVQWGPSCSLRTNRQTYMIKLTVAFRYFPNAPKSHVATITENSFRLRKRWRVPQLDANRYRCNMRSAWSRILLEKLMVLKRDKACLRRKNQWQRRKNSCISDPVSNRSIWRRGAWVRRTVLGAGR